jgi:hypothetical protein
MVPHIVNPKIGIGHKLTLLGVVLYNVLNLIVGFGYMLQETPNAVVNTYVEQAEYKTAVAGLKARYPSYCNNSATDYNFSTTWTYTDNRCDFDLEMGVILILGENAVFITTYFEDTPSNPVAAAAAGLSAGNYFVPGVEAMELSFSHTVSTSWGLHALNPELNLHALGDSKNHATFSSGQSVTVKDRRSAGHRRRQPRRHKPPQRWTTVSSHGHPHQNYHEILQHALRHTPG